MKACLSIAVLVMAVASPATHAAEPNQLAPELIAAGWINLFDGETLFGWTPTSDANWKVKDGAITVSEGEQGFLMTNSEFADYELHVEFKAPASTNSGIFLRTPLAPADPAKDCYELNIAPVDNPFPTGSLVGRVKISSKPDGYTVKLPDGTSEFRRRGGPAQTINAWDGQWHAFDVTVDGAAVRILLDGTLLATFVEAEPAANPTRGRIGLQFREGPVAFRNIRLRPLGLQPMLNGKDLAGWNTDKTEASKYEVVPPQESSGSLPLEGRAGEGGEPDTDADHPSLTLPLKGRGPEDVDAAPTELLVRGGRGQLETEASYGDFVMQLDVFVDGDALNSGIFFRSIPRDFANGYESQIQNAIHDGDPTRPVDAGTGAIYRRTAARRVVSKDREWFTKTIVATGPHLAVWVNGYQVTDWTDDRPPHDNPRNGLRLEPGTISIQGHDPTTNLRFRNLRIAEFPEKN